jgi:transcriptional antiterminator RfaH
MQQWIVLFTQPQKECVVQGILAGRGLESYLPTVRPTQFRTNRRHAIPLFPRYLFVHVDCAIVAKSSLLWTPGVVNVVSFGGEPAVVDPHVIDLIKERSALLCEHGYGGFKHGDRVRITRGPLKHLEGIFDKPMSASDRVRILIDMLGRTTVCEIEAGALERSQQPARGASSVVLS